ncbi:MAG TPA: tyrosine-type recombinase/integrase [Thermoleophilia bacterium]|nr:tyrosine-type recombinase/integrase [Thermoleophilia bacterium]
MRRGAPHPAWLRDGLMVGLLIARPLRVRAFMAIEIDKQLVRLADGFLLRFGAEDMKDGKAREFDLPEELVDPMRRYLQVHRPALLRGKQTSRLWVSRLCGPLTTDGLTRHLWHITGRAFGEAFRPHAFRHIAATTIAEEDPAHVNVIASLLGHATLAMSEKHYNRATVVKAAASYQETVRGLRRAARRKTRPRRDLGADDRSPDVAS